MIEYSPQRMFLLGFLVLAAFITFSVSLTVNNPWMGLSFDRTNPDQHVVVSYVQAGSPADGLVQPGDRLLAIASPGDEPMDVEFQDVIEDPFDVLLYSEHLRIFERQNAMFKMLSAKQVVLLFEDKGAVTVHPKAKRSLASLPFSFWFQIACEALAFFIALCVYTFRRQEMAARAFLLCSIGLLMFISAASIYSTRELAMNGGLMHQLTLLNQWGTAIFAGAGTSVLWYYPNRLHKLEAIYWGLGIYAVFALLHTLHVFEDMNLSMRYPIFLCVILNVILVYKQWKQATSDPVSRAGITWFLIAWVFGVLMIVVLRFVPVSMGFEPLLSQAYSWISLVAIYLGIAIGMFRYRLFDLDRWVFTAWYWMMGGIAIIIIDVLLLSQLSLENHIALAMSVALVGWVYFPLRQKLWWFFLSGSEKIDYQKVYTETLEIILDPGMKHDVKEYWKGVFDKVFGPLEIVQSRNTSSHTQIIDEGLKLFIPGYSDMPALELAYADQGRRFFTQEDERVAHSIWLLFRHVHEFRHAFQEGVSNERQRVARDLHDDVGAQLLSLVYRAENEANADLARSTLHELRSVIHGLESPAYALSAAFGDWHVEIRARCKDAGIRLKWEQPQLRSEIILNARQRMNLRRIFREIVTNSIRHSRTNQLDVVMDVKDDHLHAMITDYGIGFDPDKVQKGRGLRNMELRAQELGGSLRLSASENGSGTTYRCLFPLEDR